MMTNTEIETRMTNLEREMATLKARVAQKDDARQAAWWEQIAGSFRDDAAHDEAMRLGREYRLAQNRMTDE